MAKLFFPAEFGRPGPIRVVPLTLVVVFTGVAGVWWVRGLPLGIDVSVYRAGALAVAHGHALYAPLSLPSWSPGELPFVYPPVAALLFQPLGALPVQLAWGCMAVASALSLWMVLRLFIARPVRGWTLVGLLAVALCSQPVWRTIGMGQINIVLLGMVAFDVLALRGRRTGGVLTGLAAAIKLTPLFFLLHLIVVGRWRDAGRGMTAFIAATGVGTLLLPHASWIYWTSELFGGFLADKKASSENQSLGAVAARLADGGAGFWLHLVLALGCVAVCVPLVRRALRVSHAGALLVSATCALLISPISWTDHWVWVAPAAAYLATCPNLRQSVRVAYVSLIAVAFSGAFLIVGPESPHALAGQLFANAYVLAGLAAVLVAFVMLRPKRELPMEVVARV